MKSPHFDTVPYRSALALLFVLALGLGGCRAPRYAIEGAGQLYTAVNLHPDVARHTLYSTNFQTESLIPRCTPVEISAISSRKMVFRIPGDPRPYQYIFNQRHMRESMEDHLNMILSPSCDPHLPSSLGPIDAQGVSMGTVLPGMTRRGVILALGYPPSHVNDLNAPSWRYWRGRHATFTVHFNGDVVSAIE